MSQTELRNVFEGKVRRWDNGVPVHVFILPNDSLATKRFAWQVLGISPDAWNEIKTSSVANSQRTVIQELNSEIDMIRYVSLTSGAIGYINNSFMVNRNGIAQIIVITN
jgi:ABC-type phosphate transport system substrate-binding protein